MKTINGVIIKLIQLSLSNRLPSPKITASIIAVKAAKVEGDVFLLPNI
jgi:hypothetical protein